MPAPKEILNGAMHLQGENNMLFMLARNEGDLNALDDFLTQAGYRDVTVLGTGSSSVAMQVSDNPECVIRIAAIIERPVIPQLDQPVFAHSLNACDIEIIPYLPDMENYPHWRTKLDGFIEKEIEASGYRIDNTAKRSLRRLHNDIGMFTYGGYEVPMGRDSGIITPLRGSTAAPTCTSDYPPLEVQWLRQRDMMKNDDRLQRLLGAKEPKKFPQTHVIDISPQHGRKL